MPVRRLAIVLIHGTWARGAPWTREGSQLRDSLAERFGRSVDFISFPWKGSNLAGVRQRAALDLTERIKELPADVGPVVLIAHSHGGNVALWALDGDQEVRRRVAAVVCLNTPFFAGLPRNTEVLSIAFSVGVAAAVGGLGFTFGLPGAIAFVAAFLSLLAVIFIAFKVLVPKRDGVLAQLRGPSLDDVPILCVQTTDDEASSWLAFLETQLNTPFLFLNLLSRRQGGWMLLLAAAFVSVLLLVFYGVLPGEDWVFGLMWGIPGALVAGTMTVSWLGSLLVRRLALGLQTVGLSWFYDLLVRVSAYPVPIHCRSHELMVVRDRIRSDRLGLSHSVIYEDQVVLDRVGHWIERHIASHPTGN